MCPITSKYLLVGTGNVPNEKYDYSCTRFSSNLSIYNKINRFSMLKLIIIKRQCIK